MQPKIQIQIASQIPGNFTKEVIPLLSPHQGSGGGGGIIGGDLNRVWGGGGATLKLSKTKFCVNNMPK